ncbi:hypothetical protein RFI_15931, partial [Reticulomyxa filosa]
MSQSEVTTPKEVITPKQTTRQIENEKISNKFKRKKKKEASGVSVSQRANGKWQAISSHNIKFGIASSQESGGDGRVDKNISGLAITTRNRPFTKNCPTTRNSIFMCFGNGRQFEHFQYQSLTTLYPANKLSESSKKKKKNGGGGGGGWGEKEMNELNFVNMFVHLKNECANLEEQISRLQSENQELKSKTATLEDRYEKDVQQLQATLDEHVQMIASLQEELSNKEKTLQLVEQQEQQIKEK